MGLLISLFVLGLLALLCFQAWQLWYTRRELARLEQRLDESLDDQDLLEFQDRLKALLEEARGAGLSLVQSLERRQSGVEKAIALAQELEKRLGMRAQLLELAAKELNKQAPSAMLPDRASTTKKKARPKAASKAQLHVKAGAKAEIKPTADEGEALKTKAEVAEAERSYLSRPFTGTANQSPARHQKVYELADSGLNREQIAREVSLLPGEVELILNLRPGKKGQK